MSHLKGATSGFLVMIKLARGPNGLDVVALLSDFVAQYNDRMTLQSLGVRCSLFVRLRE